MAFAKRHLLFVFAPSFLALAACGSPGGEDVSQNNAALSSNEGAAYHYFVGKGLKDFQAAGIVGNLIQESSVDPGSVQYGGGPGRGIAQWSVGGRWNADTDDNVEWYAEAHGASATSLDLQLDFVWYELQTFSSYGLSDLRGSTNLTEATIAFQARFEGCGECDQSNRISYAQEVLSAYGGSSGSAPGPSPAPAAGCYSDTLGKEVPENACVQSSADSDWYQCDSGAWTDRWTDPAACNGTYPLGNAGHSSGGGAGCYSDTLGREMADNACVQSGANDDWYQCDNGTWADRWTDPTACNGVHPR
jgi:hypothetical protein